MRSSIAGSWRAPSRLSARIRPEAARSSGSQKPRNIHYYIVKIKDIGIIEGGSDGDIHWRTHNQTDVAVSQGEEREVDIRNATFTAVLQWKDLYEKVECVGIEDVNGRECLKVERTPASGSPDTVYYEKKTGLPFIIETVSDGENGKIVTRKRYEDYREVSGVMVSFKQVREINGEVAVTWTWDNVEFQRRYSAR